MCVVLLTAAGFETAIPQQWSPPKRQASEFVAPWSPKRQRLNNAQHEHENEASADGPLNNQVQRDHEGQQYSITSPTFPSLGATGQLSAVANSYPPQRSMPLAESLPDIFCQTMCDAIVRDDFEVTAHITLTQWSLSLVNLDIAIHRWAIPGLVEKLFGNTIRYSGDPEPSWHLVLEGGSEVSVQGDLTFDRAKEESISNFVGKGIQAALSKDPERRLELKRAERLTRRLSLVASLGLRTSRLRITLDAAAMSSVENSLGLNIV